MRLEQEDSDPMFNYGFRAQELKTVLPEIVNYPTTSTNKYTIEYMSMIPLLVASIKELIILIGQHENEINDLQSYRSNLAEGLTSYLPPSNTQIPSIPPPPPSLPGV